MKNWILILSVCTITAIAAIAAETATRPEAVVVVPTSRPSNPSNPANREFRRTRNRNFSRRTASTPAASTSLPSIFEEVASRNIFVRGNQHPPRPDEGAQNSSSYNPVPTPTQLILTGISLTNNGKVAFLEDQNANQVTVVRIGDKVSTGKAVNMTLDSLDYQDATGKTIRVNVGFNLAGGDVWGVTGSSASAEASTQPSGSEAGPRRPGESMEDYLRRRRAAESAR